jgi:hypothetical protein
MISTSKGISQRIRLHMDQIVAELRGASTSVETQGLAVAEMTEVLKTALADRNRFDAALTGAIGSLDKATQRTPDGELTGGLSSVKNGYRRF